MDRQPNQADENEVNPTSPPPAPDPDRDVAQRIEELPATDGAQVLENLPRELSADVTEYLDPDTAGGIMTPEVTALNEDLTVGQAIEELRRMNETLEQMFYVYVIDKRGHLVGVLSMRDLIMSRPERKLSSIMRPNVLALPATMDQEDVAG